MHALQILLVGLAVAHVIWVLAYVTGSTVVRPREGASQGRAVLHLTVATVTGLAVFAFETFIIGSLHALDVGGCISVLAFNAAVVSVCGGLKLGWWRKRLNTLRRAFSAWPVIGLYATFLILSTHASLPDYTSDGVRFYLAVAYSWVHHHAITSDLRFRFPYYAENHELLYALVYVLGLSRYVVFVNWLAGALSAMASCGIILAASESLHLDDTPPRRFVASLVSLLLPLSVTVSPVFLRWHDTAMIDTALGCYLVCAVAATNLALLEDDPWLLFAAAIDFAFLVGTKPSFLAFLPFAVAVLIVIGQTMHLKRLLITLSVVALLLFSGPWYVRNTIRDGEPVPPILNLLRYGHDIAFDREDWAGLTNDLKTSHSPKAIADFPWRFFAKTPSDDFREYASTAEIFGLYPAMLLLVMLLLPGPSKRIRPPNEVAGLVVLAALGYGLMYYFATSTLARYFLLLAPLSAAAVGYTLLYVAARFPALLYLAGAAAFTALIPSPGTLTHTFYHDYRDLNYAGLIAVMPNDSALLERNLPGYAEASALFDRMPNWHTRKNVYLEQADLNYYIQLHGGDPLGDWVGPWRYRDLATTIDDFEVANYARKYRIGAFVIAKTANVFAPQELQSLGEQLAHAGFSKLGTSDKAFDVYFHP